METKKETVELTKKEKKMVSEALDYYGHKIADREGCVSGKKFWDLIEKFK